MPSQIQHFPPEIEALPDFDGPFDAYRLRSEGCEVLFATYPAGTSIAPHTHPTNNVGVITKGQLILTIDDQVTPTGQASGTTCRLVSSTQPNSTPTAPRSSSGSPNETPLRQRARVDRRTWADLEPGAAPDGICVDADGAIWYASVPEQSCTRVAPGGEVLATVDATAVVSPPCSAVTTTALFTSWPTAMTAAVTHQKASC